MMLKPFVRQIALLAVLAALILVVVDFVVFDRRTWEGWMLQPDSINHADRRWWLNAVGPLPPDTAIGLIEPPESLSGRSGTWYHKDGGDGSPGLHGHAPLLPESGLIAYTLNSRWRIVGGRALASIDTLGYRMGVALPCIMIERRFIGPSKGSPPGVYEPGWEIAVRWGAAFINIVLLTTVFSIPFAMFHGVRITRQVRGRCFRCAYVLMPQQDVCSECGSARPGWWRHPPT